jgi:putative ABC transport system permease protein
MNEFSITFIYAFRLLKREWRRFVLPFLSLAATSVVLLLVFLLTDGSKLFLEKQSAELLGGDVEIESVYPIDIDSFWLKSGVETAARSSQINFSATIESDTFVQAVSMVVVDEAFPLYGSLELVTGEYQSPETGEIYLSLAASERMGSKVGDTVRFGEAEFLVAGIIKKEPSSLFGGFRFLPRVFISQAGFSEAKLDVSLLRAEYEYVATFDQPLLAEQEESLSLLSQSEGFDIDFAGTDGGRLVRGLDQVADFLLIAVLATAVLATVNVYASTIYLMAAWRRSFAVLLALGMRVRQINLVIVIALSYVVMAATTLGIALSLVVFESVRNFGFEQFSVLLPWPDTTISIATTIFVIMAVAVGSLIPALRNVLSLSPRQVLSQSEEPKTSFASTKTLLKNTTLALFPLVVLSVVVLDDWKSGLVVLVGIISLYAVVAWIFYLCLKALYLRRSRFGFIIKTVIAEKRADGLFGIVSFSSLFVGLLSVAVVAILQLSLEDYLSNDLSRSVPSVYVLDVQPSQKPELLSAYPDIKLFANIGARIKRIDDVYIEEELAKPNSSISGELRREFNLTFGRELPSGEMIVDGNELIGEKGTVSVDEEFASRSGIKIGSLIEFVIQGVPVTARVNNLRQTDSRSGLPFFYFILSPEDVGVFPAVYFGYSYYDEEKRLELGRFVARSMPNISVLDTAELGTVLSKIVGTLVIIVYVITIPPLLIAVLLIATLVVLSYANRRREGARLRALGATMSLVRRIYLIETTSITFVSLVAAYLIALLVSSYLVFEVLGLPTVRFFAYELLFGAVILLVLVLGLGYYLFTSDRVQLRELLAYEEGH